MARKIFFHPRVLRKRGFARFARRRNAMRRLYRSHRLYFIR